MERLTSQSGPGRRVPSAARASDGISPSLVFNALRRWWKIATPVAVLLGYVVGSCCLVPLGADVHGHGLDSDRREQASFGVSRRRTIRELFVATQMELIRSPLVLGPLLSRPEISQQLEIRESPDPLAYLESKIEIKAVGRSELYTVNYTCGDPKDAQAVVNAVVDSYIQYLADADARSSTSMTRDASGPDSTT